MTIKTITEQPIMGVSQANPTLLFIVLTNSDTYMVQVNFNYNKHYKPKLLDTLNLSCSDSLTYMSLATSVFQRPWSFSSLSAEMAVPLLLLTADVIPPERKLCKP